MNRRQRRHILTLAFSVTWIGLGFLGPLVFGETGEEGLRLGVSFPQERSKQPLDGRMLLMISTDVSAEPRFQISDGPKTQLVFGIDVDGLKPQQVAVFDKSVFGYPVKSIAEVPAGEYWVQALLNRYETFRRGDGHTVKLPMDKGRGTAVEQEAGQPLQRAPENLP